MGESVNIIKTVGPANYGGKPGGAVAHAQQGLDRLGGTYKHHARTRERLLLQVARVGSLVGPSGSQGRTSASASGHSRLLLRSLV